MKKVLITLPEELLCDIDRAAAAQGTTRSAFIRQGISQVLNIRHKMEIEDRMRRGYQSMADINLAWAKLGLDADEKTYLAYEAAISEDDTDDTQGRDIQGGP